MLNELGRQLFAEEAGAAMNDPAARIATLAETAKTERIFIYSPNIHFLQALKD